MFKQSPYSTPSYAPEPTGITRWMRTAFIWQCFRFVAINIKMIKLMARSHH